MKKKANIILITLLLHYVNFDAQNDSLKSKSFHISSISFGVGVHINQPALVTIDSYKKMAPQDSLVNISHAADVNNGSPLNPNAYVSVFFGFKRYNKKTQGYFTQRENRVGIRFYSSGLIPLDYTHASKSHLDTLTTSGKTYYGVDIDSTKYFFYEVRRNTFLLDFGSIFISHDTHLLTGYIGYNIGIGVGYGTSVHAQFSNYTTLNNHKGYNESKFGPFKIEQSNLKNTYTANASMVWGVNFKLARTKKFWSRCVLNIEMRSGIVSENIEKFGNYTRAAMCGHFAIKFLI